MGFFRAFGALAVLLSGLLFGTSLNRGLREGLAQARGYEGLLRWIRLQISCFSLPAEEILRRADPALLRACGWDRREPPSELSALLRGAEPSDGEIKRLLWEFSSEFGREYREEQVARCDYYLALLHQRAEELRSRGEGKKRVNLTLSAAGAAALVILFI